MPSARSPDPPEIDTGRVGVSLVSVAYGVVFAEVFIRTDVGYSKLPAVAWSQLGLAASAIVLSWIGYYNNRDELLLWRPRFTNIPFFQYLISVGILAAYYGLIATAEVASDKSHPLHASVRPEALLIAAIFVMYLLWDILQRQLQTNTRYTNITEELAAFEAPSRPGSPNFSSTSLLARTSARFWVTAVFTAIFFLALEVLWLVNPRESAVVVTVDVVYALALLAYRVFQDHYAASEGVPIAMP